MLRLAGLLGIVMALGLLGIMKSQQLGARVKLLEDFLQMVLELKGQISYFKEPLPAIFEKVKKKSDSKAFMLLNQSGEELRQKDAEIAQIWPKTVSENYKGQPLTKDDLKLFDYLGTFIGQTDYDNHLFHFSYMEEKLNSQINDSKNDLKVKGPMYRKIGFFLGAILAILFI